MGGHIGSVKTSVRSYSFTLRTERLVQQPRSENKGGSPVNCIRIAIKAAIFLILSDLAVKARIANSFRPLFSVCWLKAASSRA